MVKGSEITEVSTAMIFMFGVNPVRAALNFL
jgi:DNA-binding GntR family transcriptional regulator